MGEVLEHVLGEIGEELGNVMLPSFLCLRYVGLLENTVGGGSHEEQLAQVLRNNLNS